MFLVNHILGGTKVFLENKALGVLGVVILFFLFYCMFINKFFKNYTSPLLMYASVDIIEPDSVDLSII
jgi:hypothetical protein